MFLPLGICSGLEEGGDVRQRLQERKLRRLTLWRDAIERQLAAVNASISTLEQQMVRDRPEPQG
jgi:hypothetical protein